MANLLNMPPWVIAGREFCPDNYSRYLYGQTSWYQLWPSSKDHPGGSRNHPKSGDSLSLGRLSVYRSGWCGRLRRGGVTCYALATHRPIYSYFPALRAPSFLTIIPIYTHIYPPAPSGLDRRPPRWNLSTRILWWLYAQKEWTIVKGVVPCRKAFYASQRWR
jgi:hypothetical protein